MSGGWPEAPRGSGRAGGPPSGAPLTALCLFAGSVASPTSRAMAQVRVAPDPAAAGLPHWLRAGSEEGVSPGAPGPSLRPLRPAGTRPAAAVTRRASRGLPHAASLTLERGSRLASREAEACSP